MKTIKIIIAVIFGRHKFRVVYPGGGVSPLMSYVVAEGYADATGGIIVYDRENLVDEEQSNRKGNNRNELNPLHTNTLK